MLECRLSQNLNKIGVHADIAAQYDSTVFDGVKSADYWKKLGVSEVFWLKSNQSFGIIGAFFRLLKIVQRNKYDIIITHHSGLDIIAGLVTIITGKKHVVAFHDYFYKEKIGTVRLVIWKFFLNQIDAAYSISNYVKYNVNEVLGVKLAINTTVYNSITFANKMALESNAHDNIRGQYGIPYDAKIIISSGRINFNKGFDLTISLLKEVLEETNTFLMIMGGANNQEEEAYLHSLKVLIKEEKLEQKVFLTGYRNDAFRVMKQCDVYIHMARHEGFGLVLMEAIAAGIPIVASNIGGIPEVLKDTPYLTFALEDKKGIMMQIEKYLSMSSAEKKAMVKQVDEILSYYTDERRVLGIKDILEEIII